MKIEGKSVRSLTKVLNASGESTKVRFTVALEDIGQDKALQLGFDSKPNVGDYLIPAVLGKYTKFNANGDVRVRDDLPKRPESVMFFGASRDWQGGIHHGIRTRTIDKYPREQIPAPSEFLYIVEINGTNYISSTELNLDDSDETKNIHMVNIMLECFSGFEIFDIEKQQIIGPKLKRLQWDVLPAGEYPWDRSKSIISKSIESLNKKDKEVIEYRMKTISRHKPDFLATGRAGFSSYLVYGFKDKGVYVLESTHLDNATYVFNSDWERLSQLTKNDIINSSLPHSRIIHNAKWAATIGRVIKKQ